MFQIISTHLCKYNSLTWYGNLFQILIKMAPIWFKSQFIASLRLEFVSNPNSNSLHRHEFVSNPNSNLLLLFSTNLFQIQVPTHCFFSARICFKSKFYLITFSQYESNSKSNIPQHYLSVKAICFEWPKVLVVIYNNWQMSVS